jgi:speckle-type POZ protein
VGNNKKKIGVHKAIIGAQSPVFAAMFEHNTEEKNKNQIEITDLEPEIVHEMFRFIYSGTVEDLEKNAFGLLTAGDKYGLIRLKAICEREIASKLCLETAVPAAIAGYLHNAHELKDLASRFILQHVDQILTRKEWTDKLYRYPALMGEMLSHTKNSVSSSFASSFASSSSSSSGINPHLPK